MSTGFDFAVSNKSADFMLLDVDIGNNNCLDTEFITPNPFLGQKFSIPPGSTFVSHLYRKDGHGCDGHQGVFQARPIFIAGNKVTTKDYQQFSFDSHGSIGLVGPKPNYGSALSQHGAATTAIWTITPSPVVISDEQKIAAMKQYAPRIWAAQDEEYFACSTDWAFPFLTRVKRDDGNYWLYTKQELSSPSDDSLPMFKGDLASARIYAFWVPKDQNYFDVCYFIFYGYNRGKEVLDTIWGNHVGDWEHVTVRLDPRLKPVQIHLSAHDGGETISWSGIQKSGTHPVAYAAWGSHALYSTSGDHTYKSIPKLTDKCSAGTSWDSWDSIETYDYAAKKGLGGSVWPSWMTDDYTGTIAGMDPADPHAGGIYRWGNGKNGCLAGQCRLEDGPTGPIDKGDCWKPDTFG